MKRFSAVGLGVARHLEEKMAGAALDEFGGFVR